MPAQHRQTRPKVLKGHPHHIPAASAPPTIGSVLSPSPSVRPDDKIGVLIK